MESAKAGPRCAGHGGVRGAGASQSVPLWGKRDCNALGACSGPQTPTRGSKVAAWGLGARSGQDSKPYFPFPVRCSLSEVADDLITGRLSCRLHGAF